MLKSIVPALVAMTVLSGTAEGQLRSVDQSIFGMD